MMKIGSPRNGARILSAVFMKSSNSNDGNSKYKSTTRRKRTIIVGLKSDKFSREMLLHLLDFFVLPFDIVLAVHVHHSLSLLTFDPNSFHMHEDICKSKQVDFHVKVSVGSSYATELSHQVRISFASTLVIGCNSCCPEDSSVYKLLKSLPPSCNLLVMDRKGKIVLQKQGTSQQGSLPKALQSTVSSIKSQTKLHLQKSSTMPTSVLSSTPQENDSGESRMYTKSSSFPEVTKVTKRSIDRFSTLDIAGTCRRYYLEELTRATCYFSTDMLIGKGGNSKVYRANFGDGRSAAVKVLNVSQHSEDDLFQEVEILNSLKHENIIQLLGFCYCKNMQAVVYNLLKESLRHKLKHLKWCERMQLSIGVAKALDYLHSSSPPIVHRDVKSSNILLSENCHPQLSDFGSALTLNQAKLASTYSNPTRVVGTFGYLAPEYMMYGKIDEKIDVYSYGVVLLELITGKAAIQTKAMSKQESLVLWARSLLSSGLWDRLIDPDLNNEYDKNEMKTMMIAARFCLLHSAKRPSIKTILCLLEEPNSWRNTMHRKREEVLESIISGSGSELSRQNGSEFCDTKLTYDV